MDWGLLTYAECQVGSRISGAANRPLWEELKHNALGAHSMNVNMRQDALRQLGGEDQSDNNDRPLREVDLNQL